MWSRWGVDRRTRGSASCRTAASGHFAALPPGEPFRASWALGDGPVVLFLARLHERKGAQFLIPAFAQARDVAPDARLVIAGPDEGMLAELKALAAAHGVGERVTFTGMLSGDDRLAALSAADLFALPAVGEGFSMAVRGAGVRIAGRADAGCHFLRRNKPGRGCGGTDGRAAGGCAARCERAVRHAE